MASKSLDKREGRIVPEQVADSVAEPQGEIIESLLSVCKNCGNPIASMMGSPWLHANSGIANCMTDDPRQNPPQ